MPLITPQPHFDLQQTASAVLFECKMDAFVNVT